MEKNTLKEKEIQRKMTKERNKNRNTFGVLQEEDTEPLLDEEEPPQLLKQIKMKRKYLKVRKEEE